MAAETRSTPRGAKSVELKQSRLTMPNSFTGVRSLIECVKRTQSQPAKDSPDTALDGTTDPWAAIDVPEG